MRAVRLQRVDDDGRVVGGITQRPQPDLAAQVARVYGTSTDATRDTVC